LIVREALPEDAATWLRLRESLWSDEDPIELRSEVETFFRTGLPTVAAAMLAFDGDVAVGFAEVSLRSYVPGASKSPAPFLEGWYVEPEGRGRGVGRALVTAVERWARDRGHSELGSDSILDNEPSALAHEALGFHEVERVRFFVKSLDARP